MLVVAVNDVVRGSIRRNHSWQLKLLEEVAHRFEQQPCFLLELDEAGGQGPAIAGLQLAATFKTQPGIHLGQTVQQQCQTLGDPIARRTQPRIPRCTLVS